MQEVPVFVGDAGELADHLRRERAAEVGDEVGASPSPRSASTSSAHTRSTRGSSARMRGGLSTDARILRIFV